MALEIEILQSNVNERSKSATLLLQVKFDSSDVHLLSISVAIGKVVSATLFRSNSGHTVLIDLVDTLSRSFYPANIAVDEQKKIIEAIQKFISDCLNKQILNDPAYQKFAIRSQVGSNSQQIAITPAQIQPRVQVTASASQEEKIVKRTSPAEVANIISNARFKYGKEVTEPTIRLLAPYLQGLAKEHGYILEDLYKDPDANAILSKSSMIRAVINHIRSNGRPQQIASALPSPLPAVPSTNRPQPPNTQSTAAVPSRPPIQKLKSDSEESDLIDKFLQEALAERFKKCKEQYDLTVKLYPFKGSGASGIWFNISITDVYRAKENQGKIPPQFSNADTITLFTPLDIFVDVDKQLQKLNITSIKTQDIFPGNFSEKLFEIKVKEAYTRTGNKLKPLAESHLGTQDSTCFYELGQILNKPHLDAKKEMDDLDKRMRQAGFGPGSSAMWGIDQYEPKFNIGYPSSFGSGFNFGGSGGYR